VKTSQSYKIDCSLPPVRWLDCGYEELIITGLHTVATGDLPQLHKDPFDRLLLAQSKVDGISTDISYRFYRCCAIGHIYCVALVWAPRHIG